MAVFLVMGIPASGKSTFCSRMKESQPEKVVTYSFDDFRKQNNINTGTAKGARKLFENHVYEKLKHSEYIVHLIEDTFHLKSMRRPFYRMAYRLGYDVGVVWMCPGICEALLRNRNRRVGKQPEKTMWKIYETEEEPDEITFAVDLTSPDQLNDVVQLLEMTNMNIWPERGEEEEEVIVEPIVNEPSRGQELDVISRKIVGEIIKSGEICDIDAEQLNEARKYCMKKWKNDTKKDIDSVYLKADILKFYNENVKHDV